MLKHSLQQWSLACVSLHTLNVNLMWHIQIQHVCDVRNILFWLAGCESSSSLSEDLKLFADVLCVIIDQSNVETEVELWISNEELH